MGDYRFTTAFSTPINSMLHSQHDDGDERPNRNSIDDLTTDDTDQQFWGDNELDSTSHSDIDAGSSRNKYIPSLSRLPDIPTSAVNRLCITEESEQNPTYKVSRICYTLEPQRASTSIPSDPLLYQQSISSMSTQLSSLTRNVHGATSRTRIRACAPIRARYLAAKRAREAEINSQGASSSSDSDSPMERPVRERRRSFSLTSDDDQVTALPGDKCPSCNVRPKNAIIVHGKIGHQCFCYQCSMKLMRSNGECGMCHRKVRRVVKNVVVKGSNKDLAMVIDPENTEEN